MCENWANHEASFEAACNTGIEGFITINQAYLIVLKLFANKC